MNTYVLAQSQVEALVWFGAILGAAFGSAVTILIRIYIDHKRSYEGHTR